MLVLVLTPALLGSMTISKLLLYTTQTSSHTMLITPGETGVSHHHSSTDTGKSSGEQYDDDGWHKL